MSGKGSPEVVADGSGLRVAVVAASWHDEVMGGLLDGARRGLAECGVTDPLVVRVPGTVELGVACARLATTHDALVALGVVVRGGTPHFDYVCGSATSALTDIAVRTGVPIGFGVLTCDDDEQALDRAGLPGSREDKGREAALAAVATADTLRRLGPLAPRPTVTASPTSPSPTSPSPTSPSPTSPSPTSPSPTHDHQDR